MNDKDLDRAPLLNGDEAEGSRLWSPTWRRESKRSLLARTRSLRMPLLLLAGLMLFLLGYGVRPSMPARLSWKTNPHLGQAVKVRVLRALLKERYPMREHSSTEWRQKNMVALDKLATCIERNDCAPGQQNVILLASYHFGVAVGGGTGGEDLWARSTMRSFTNLNYTILLTWGHMDTLMIYQSIPDMVPVIIWEGGEWARCQQRNDTNYADLEKQENASPGDWQIGKKACIQRLDFPEGIPWWKSFVFTFWGGEVSPLGGDWALAPEDYTTMTNGRELRQYLGYSIEERCTSQPIFSVREHRALILGKNERYFEKEGNRFAGILAAARDKVHPIETATGLQKFELLAVAGEHSREKPAPLPEKDLTTIGRLPQAEWVETVSRSKMLLGIGDPVLSPSPYDALCVGVPFINPISDWDKDHPEDRNKWNVQQEALKLIEEPYVYHVQAHNEEALAAAFQRAADTPIGRYIPPNMRREAVTERHRLLVETDWHARAKDVFTSRYKSAPEYKHLVMEPQYNMTAPVLSGGAKRRRR